MKQLLRRPDRHPFATLLGIAIALGMANFWLADPIIGQLGAPAGQAATVLAGVAIALAIRAVALRLTHTLTR